MATSPQPSIPSEQRWRSWAHPQPGGVGSGSEDGGQGRSLGSMDGRDTRTTSRRRDENATYGVVVVVVDVVVVVVVEVVVVVVEVVVVVVEVVVVVVEVVVVVDVDVVVVPDVVVVVVVPGRVVVVVVGRVTTVVAETEASTVGMVGVVVDRGTVGSVFDFRRGLVVVARVVVVAEIVLGAVVGTVMGDVVGAGGFASADCTTLVVSGRPAR